MAVSHWCKEHQTVWFKKGKMKGFAHPITDENGTPSGEWCNEPEATEQPTPKSSRGSSDASIETQVAYKGLIELAVAKIIDTKSQHFLTAMNWAMSKLGNWASMGEPVVTSTEKPDKTSTDEPRATEAQLKKIYATAKDKGYDNEGAVAIMMRLYHKASSRELSKKEASDFITLLSQGKYLGEKAEELEPDDLPF